MASWPSFGKPEMAPSSPKRKAATSCRSEPKARAERGTTDRCTAQGTAASWPSGCCTLSEASLQFSTWATGGICPWAPQLHWPSMDSVALPKSSGCSAWRSVFLTYEVNFLRSCSSPMRSRMSFPPTGRPRASSSLRRSTVPPLGSRQAPAASAVQGSSKSKLPRRSETMATFEVLIFFNTPVRVLWYSSPRMTTKAMPIASFEPTSSQRCHIRSASGLRRPKREKR